jgi:hypothetical protein
LTRFFCVTFVLAMLILQFLPQDAEAYHRQMPASTNTLALMEAVRRQRKLLLLWDDALHALLVCALPLKFPFYFHPFSTLAPFRPSGAQSRS